MGNDPNPAGLQALRVRENRVTSGAPIFALVRLAEYEVLRKDEIIPVGPMAGFPSGIIRR